MYLKKLEIYGFKSFAKKTILEFEPGITSIVGPNGAGKSNIADSLRWVFGEQSMKLLRGKKSEDVIFAGSDKKARLGSAAVSVYFNNADHKMPIDYDEVVLTRRVYRDGNSDYLINNHQVRLLDIQELVAKSGFANPSYCVVGQGMIDQLILGGPAAVKELVEEAVGVKPYYLKRERTVRRLEHTGVNLEQVKSLIHEIEPRLRSLRRQTRKLEQRSDLEQELEQALAARYAQIFRGLERQIREVEAKARIFTKQLTDLTNEIKTLSADIESQEREAETSGASYQKLKEELKGLQTQKLKLQEDVATVRGQLKVDYGQRRALHIDFTHLKKKFRAAYEKFLELLKNFNPGTAKEVQNQFEEVSQIIEAADAEAQSLYPGIPLLQEKEKKLSQDLEKLFARIKSLDVELQDQDKREEDYKRQLFVKERLLRTKQDMLVKTSEEKNLLSVEEAKLLTRKEAYEQEARAELGPNFHLRVQEYGAGTLPPELQEKIANLKKQLQIIGGVDDLIVQEYRETEERYQYLSTQLSDLEKAVADFKKILSELDEVIKKEFHEAFTRISEKFAEYFRLLFSGGRATMAIIRERPKLEAEEETLDARDASADLDQPQSDRLAKPEIVGIDIKATPPGKKLAGISALSGGERALTSIALLSAILASYPSPFVVLDEVDAALDEANSIRFGKILGSLAHRTQFITVTHNRETMRQSHTLYGVTMGDDGISRILSLKLEQAAVYISKN